MSDEPRDEVALVLAELGRLAEAVSCPVVRSCLEWARDDILHLTGSGDPTDETGIV
jgi:hypothetical protein